jgi:alkylation response protein AidB-like acyl-CoA dehydrogenase
VETARSAAYAAAWVAVDPGRDGNLAHWASVAKVYCSEALFAVASEAVQIHGGIAITWEHDAQLYLKRAHGSMQLFGQPRSFVSRLGVDVLG